MDHIEMKVGRLLHTDGLGGVF